MKTFLGHQNQWPDGTLEITDHRGVPIFRIHQLTTEWNGTQPPTALIEITDIEEIKRAGLDREIGFLGVPGLQAHNWESRNTLAAEILERDWEVSKQDYYKSREHGNGYLLAIERWI